MKARLEVLLAQELAFNQFGQPWSTLKEIDQNQLRTNVHQERLQDLWIGTFHSLFSRLLRYDIEKYTDCLLYTSPSPRDVLRSRMPSAA